MSIGRIRKNDEVMARKGVSAGKSGKVLQVIPAKGRAVVEGLNMLKKTLRKSQDNPQGGIVEKEGSIALANLTLFCPDCKKGVRARRSREGEARDRVCSKCGHAFGA